MDSRLDLEAVKEIELLDGDGETRILPRLASMYADSMERGQAELRELIASSSPKATLKIEALKASSQYLGVIGVVSILDKIGSGRPEQMDALLEELEREVRAACEALSKYISKNK